MDELKIHIVAHVYLTQEQYNYLVEKAKSANDFAARHGYDHTFSPENFISGIVRRAIDQKLTGH